MSMEGETKSGTIEHVYRVFYCTGLRAGPTPRPPVPAAESREPQSESHRTVQIHVKSSPAAPPTWPTTWIQASLSVTKTQFLSHPHRKYLTTRDLCQVTAPASSPLHL